VRWSPTSQRLLRAAKLSLGKQLKSYLSLRCTHVKGRGGAKASVQFAQTMAGQYRYVARFDIRSYYESMNHGVLLKLLEDAGIDAEGYALVCDYLSLPDTKLTGCGMVAGGSISPLLGAVYLTPLDRAMEQLQPRHNIRYQRFMDDYLIFAPTRHKLKAALRCMYRILEQLKLTVHPDKRSIGTTHRGFDFLGYRIHPDRLLRPAVQSLNRLIVRSRRLYEQGVDVNRLRQYVQRWFIWLHSGLRNRVNDNPHAATNAANLTKNQHCLAVFSRHFFAGNPYCRIALLRHQKSFHLAATCRCFITAPRTRQC
jgi:RNA-directed DNA polymerase